LNKNILITGSGGLIGHELIEQLKTNNTIWAVGRNDNFARDKNVHHIQLDLTSDWNESLFPENIDVIYHLAQSEHFREFPDKALDVFRVNTLSTMKLLDYAYKKKVKKFIYASSGGIYGFGDTGFTEEDEIAAHGDIGFYIGTKLCSEILVENYFQHFDINIIRFFFVYGPRQRKTMLIPRLISNIKEGNTVQLQGPDGIRVNPIYVTDAANALIKCMDVAGSHKINIGGKEVITLKQLCELIGDSVGKKPAFDINDKVEPKNIYGDISRMTRLLGEPRVNIREGIKKML
jgi:nucleoside-diphosphate-sugar epimerase